MRANVLELAERAAVEERRADDIVARFDQIAERQILGGHARCGGHGRRASFERSHALFENRGRGIAQTGVDVTLFAQGEAGRALFGAVENIGRGLVDRQCARTGHGIGLLACVYLQRFESVVFRSHISLFVRYKKIRPQRKPDCVVRAYGKVTPGGIGCACTSYPWSSYRGVFRGTCCRMCSLQSFQLRICFQWCKYSGFFEFYARRGIFFWKNLSLGRNFACQRCDCGLFC